jgi:hypothetical protein
MPSSTSPTFRNQDNVHLTSGRMYLRSGSFSRYVRWLSPHYLVADLLSRCHRNLHDVSTKERSHRLLLRPDACPQRKTRWHIRRLYRRFWLVMPLHTRERSRRKKLILRRQAFNGRRKVRCHQPRSPESLFQGPPLLTTIEIHILRRLDNEAVRRRSRALISFRHVARTLCRPLLPLAVRNRWVSCKCRAGRLSAARSMSLLHNNQVLASILIVLDGGEAAISHPGD